VTGISTATAISVGTYHACAIVASGSVQCWGENPFGQLGNGTTTDSNTPVTVSGIGNAIAIATTGGSTCALLASGEIECWGWEVGNGGSRSSIPVLVAGISTATAITAGDEHVCAALRGGPVFCWGDNSYGQLGDGTTNNSGTPVRVHAIYAPTRLAAGSWDTCALFSGGVMKCWGLNDRGQLGNRRRTGLRANPLPVNVVGTPGVVWTSSDPTTATIGARGLATGRAAGNTTITATTPGFINDNAVLTVH
jgi:alpha-tubulin suppressor-like RCC1 family protein